MPPQPTALLVRSFHSLTAVLIHHRNTVPTSLHSLRSRRPRAPIRARRSHLDANVERERAPSPPIRDHPWTLQPQKPTSSASFVVWMLSAASAVPATARTASTFSGTTSDS